VLAVQKLRPFSKSSFGKRPAKLFNEFASRPQIGKTPSRIDLVLPNNLSPMSRLNVSGFMKLDNSTAQFDLQSVGRNSKLDDIGDLRSFLIAL